MTESSKRVFFSYYWFLDEKEEDVTSIRIYGVNVKEENICVRVDDFQPYVYIELPSDITWTGPRAQILGNKLDQLIPKNKAISKSFEMKYKLYGVQLDEEGNRKKFPYLKCTFSHKDDIKKLGYALKKSINVLGLGFITLKMHEQDADPILQFVSNLDIPTAGWICFKGKEVEECEKITLCHKEYIVKSRNICKYVKNTVGKVKIMGFDIEVNSTNPFAMPNPVKPGDKVFQISCVFTRDGSEIYDNYLLTLGEPDPKILGEDTTIQMFDTEYELLEGFTELIREENPNIIVGYNILQFDIHYMIERAKREFCGTFYKMGFHKYNNSKEKTIKWSSSAYKNQEFQFLDAEGRVFVDLLPLIQRDYKFNNYQLKTVSINLLGDTKDDLSVKNIFKCYRIGTKKELDGSYSPKSKKAMGIVGRYCVKDSILVVKLMEKMQTWVGLCEQAKTYNTSIFSIYTQGQQIKVFSQVYKYCLSHDIVVEKDGYVAKEDERYVGAHVFPPVPGLYERVLPFDFCLSGDTLINLSNGLSKRIDSFNKDTLVMGFNKESNAFENFSFINGLQKKGIKDTVKIYFQDGSSIVSTPEHKFMMENGEWCEAKDLKNKYVKSGIKFPEDKKCNLETDWKLKVDEYILNMTTDEERDKSLAFARMCGYILSDGSIYLTTRNGRKCAEACFGTMFDALAFKRDINLFSNVDVTIRRRDGDGNKEREKKGTTLTITIPSSLSKMFHSLEDIIVGKRATQEMKLPKFILEDNCPLSIIREFLAGLFGGDGGSSVLETIDSVTGINFKWTTIEKFTEQMKNVFYKIKNLLEKFNINCNINKPCKIKYTEKCIKPKDYKENPRYDVNLCILIDSLTYFNNNIGFRYCINKMGKSYFISMYIGMKEKTRIQRLKILDKSNELININVKNVFSRKKGNITFTHCLEIAREELLDKEPALYPISLSSTYDLTYDRHERIRHSDKNRKYSLHKKKFPSPIVYFKDINVLEWFTQKYLIKTDDINIPSFRQKVLDVREHEPTEVFDIEVDKVHNFLGNGVTVSNCSLYPSVIIAYNIDYSTIVFDESIPDRLCNVMTWSDHSACLHDPKVIRKNKLTAYIDKQQLKLKELREKRDKKINKLCRHEIVNEIDSVMEEMKPYREERAQLSKTISKNVMCAERHYRFLKEPKGVIPTILQNLLDARANTRTEIKIHKKEMTEIEDKDKLNDLKLLNVVLDKRQLAYKISANSVRGTTPIPCLLNGNFIYKTIEELSMGDWKFINDTQEVSSPIQNLEVWSDLGFTKPKFVMRHVMKENLYRVNTHTGCVDCTKDHSLLRKNGIEVKPKDLNIGDELMHYDFPIPIDSPLEPLYRNLSNYIIDNYVLENQDEELAFIHGLFFAEGTCGNWGVLEKSKTSWIIYNQDLKLLERAKNILNKLEKENFIITKYYDSSRCYHLKPTKNIIDITKKYREMFYDKRKYKKFPDYIFNAPYNIRLSFFLGYYRGDGNRNLDVGIVISNKGQIGSASLFYLAKSLGYEVSVAYSADKDADFTYRLHCSLKLRSNNTDRIKVIDRIYQTEEKYDTYNKDKIVIRNDENIIFVGKKSLYRNITILCNRFPRQKLLNSLDDAIIGSEKRNSYIMEYNTKNKKIKYKKYCCGKEYNIGIKNLKLNLPEIYNLCDCKKNIIEKFYNNKNIYIEEEYKEYVYDIETENSHFAAGVGNMIVHNSMYGAMGVKKGYLPFMPGAMSCTYMGRTNIEIVAKVIPEKYGGELVYGDSVTGDTPILCKINGNICYRTIDNIPNFGWNKYRTEKEYALPNNVEVWSERGFTKIKNIIRHKTNKKIYRILTHTGVVDATEDHGLLDSNSNKISPTEIRIGNKLLISDLPELKEDFYGINKDLAFVMGLFYADGSCGNYCCPSGNKNSWAINKSNRLLLEKCKDILNKSEKKTIYELEFTEFKIYETMESSSTLKLEVIGDDTKNFVKIWRELFYDNNKYKKIPDEIFRSTKEIRQSFLDGYYSGDGDKDINGYYRFDNKGKIGSAGLYLLATSLGYKVSINTRKDKPLVYRLTCTKLSQRKLPHVVKKINLIGEIDDYVYDIETENHHFSAGIGKLIVHNTDSNYIHFPHLKTAHESWEHAEMVAEEVSKLFPKPISLAFEEAIYWQFFILTKKRYMYKSCGKNGVIEDRIGKKGVILARRDSAVLVRTLYERTIEMIFDNIPHEDILYFILQELNKICSNSFPHKDYVITKAVGDVNEMTVEPFIDEKGIKKARVGNYTVPILPTSKTERDKQLLLKDADDEDEYYKKCLPAVVQLAEKMRSRGQRVDAGTRLEYVIIDNYVKNDKQYNKLENLDYFVSHSDILKIDFSYYVKLLINPIDQLLNVAFDNEKNNNKYRYKYQKDFLLHQYDFRTKVRSKVIEEIRNLFKPAIKFES